MKGKLTRNEMATPEMVNVAIRRTMQHLHNLQMVDFDLKQVLVNCYLQGVLDMGTTIINKGWLAPALMEDKK